MGEPHGCDNDEAGCWPAKACEDLGDIAALGALGPWAAGGRPAGELSRLGAQLAGRLARFAQEVAGATSSRILGGSARAGTEAEDGDQ
jgi:hypothetical protein